MPKSESVPFLGLEAGELEPMAIAAGAAAVRFFGGYDESPTAANKAPID